jgi:hypothetical protein
LLHSFVHSFVSHPLSGYLINNHRMSSSRRWPSLPLCRQSGPPWGGKTHEHLTAILRLFRNSSSAGASRDAAVLGVDEAFERVGHAVMKATNCCCVAVRTGHSLVWLCVAVCAGCISGRLCVGVCLHALFSAQCGCMYQSSNRLCARVCTVHSSLAISLQPRMMRDV